MLQAASEVQSWNNKGMTSETVLLAGKPQVFRSYYGVQVRFKLR